MTLVLFLFAWLAQFPLPTHFPSLFSNIPRPLFFSPTLECLSVLYWYIYVMHRIFFRHKRSVECITQITSCGNIIILSCNIIWPLCLCGKCYFTYSDSFSTVSFSHTNLSRCSVTVCEGTGWYWAQGQYPSAPYKQTSHWTQHTHLNLHTGTLTFIGAVSMPVSCRLRVVYTDNSVLDSHLCLWHNHHQPIHWSMSRWQ